MATKLANKLTGLSLEIFDDAHNMQSDLQTETIIFSIKPENVTSSANTYSAVPLWLKVMFYFIN